MSKLVYPRRGYAEEITNVCMYHKMAGSELFMPFSIWLTEDKEEMRLLYRREDLSCFNGFAVSFCCKVLNCRTGEVTRKEINATVQLPRSLNVGWLLLHERSLDRMSLECDQEWEVHPRYPKLDANTNRDYDQRMEALAPARSRRQNSLFEKEAKALIESRPFKLRIE